MNRDTVTLTDETSTGLRGATPAAHSIELRKTRRATRLDVLAAIAAQ
jgi:hypothetical protein